LERSIYLVEHITAGALLLVAIYGVIALGGSAAGAHSAIEFASFAIAALVIPWLILSERSPRIPAVMVVCSAIPVWGALQLMLGVSASDFDTRNAILDGAVFAALFFISAQMLRDSKLRRRVLEVLFVLGFAASAAALVSPLIRQVDRGHYCAFVELLLPIGLYLLCDATQKRMRYVWAVLATSLIASALITGSRAGCAIVILEVVAVPMVMYARGHTRVREARTPIFAMAGMVAIFAVSVGYEQLASRFESGDPANGRNELVAAAMRMAGDRPWTGFGLGSFGAVYPAYTMLGGGLPVSHAYNDWVEWTATGGVPLLALYLTLFGLMLPLMLRYAWAIGAAAMCLHALADFPFEIPALLVLNAILLGAASAGSD